MTELDQKINLSAYVTADSRGTGMLSLFLTMNRLGYPKHGRINTVGGVTYVQTRNGNTAPSSPTLLLSQEEATVIMTSILNYVYGPSWNASPQRIRDLEEELEELRRENVAMRKGKKAVETQLREARDEMDSIRDLRRRYEDVMTVVKAVGMRHEIHHDCE